MLTFTRLMLDNRIKALKPALKDYDATKFRDLLDPAITMALAEYQQELIEIDHPFVRGGTFSEVTPPATGAEKINTAIGDVYQIAMAPATAEQVAGDTIFVNQSTTVFKDVPRMSIDDIIAGGTGETVCAFWENKGTILLYLKDGTISAAGTVHFNFYRTLTAPAADGDALDILARHFTLIVDKTLQYIPVV